MSYFIAVIVVIAALFLLLPFVTWWAWNMTMPQLFHLPTITSWAQALALNVLAGALIKTTQVRSSGSK